MSRRNKTQKELEITQFHKKESQSYCSRFALNNYVITEKGGDKKCYALDIVVSAISKSLANLDIMNMGGMHNIEFSIEKAIKKRAMLTEQIQQTIIGVIEAQDESEEVDNISKRGRRKIQQLLGKFKNSEVVSWFDRIRTKFNKVVESLKELMVCFFCAVFDLKSSESRHGKAVCFYKMIEAHLKEKIPSMSTFQKALKWFKGWRIEVTAWKNKQAEEEKHSIWEQLFQLILKELPFIEPRLAFC